VDKFGHAIGLPTQLSNGPSKKWRGFVLVVTKVAVVVRVATLLTIFAVKLDLLNNERGKNSLSGSWYAVDPKAACVASKPLIPFR
jgi:hypothetical protein